MRRIHVVHVVCIIFSACMFCDGTSLMGKVERKGLRSQARLTDSLKALTRQQQRMVLQVYNNDTL